MNKTVRQYLATPTVLIVDDNETFRRTAAAALREAGYAVTEAENGLAACRRLRQTALPHLILLDLLMPVMDGWQFRDRLIADVELRSVPVIVTTAVGEDYQQENILRATAYLPKPCGTQAVVAMVQKHCPLYERAYESEAPCELAAGAA